MFVNSIVAVAESKEEIRLIDDAFGKICNMVNDSCMRVRAEAAGLLVSTLTLPPNFPLHSHLIST